MAAVGGGRSTLANQGSLYHVSWRPRLPDNYRAWAEKQAETVKAEWRLDILLTVTPRVKLYNSSPFAS